MLKLTQEFRRVTAVAVMAAASFGLAACHSAETDQPQPQSRTRTRAHKPRKPGAQPDILPSSPATYSAAPASVEHGFCLYGCPTGTPESNIIVARSLYVLSNNAETKFADWVAYGVSPATIGPTHPRNWHRDARLPADQTLSPRDYKNVREVLHADRGHQAPLASLTGSPDWQDADYLSNITPQAVDLNEGAWEHLEEAERRLALNKNTMEYSVTGPYYDHRHPMPRLPHAHLDHVVPNGYWKVVALPEGDRLLTATFRFSQDTPRDANYCDYAVPMREAEDAAQIIILPRMEKSQREKIENSHGGLLPELGCK